MIKTGKAAAIDSDQAADQMLMLIDRLTTAGFEQYEISNFAKNGMYAKHNTNYWKGKHYLGIGPSAHSFNGTSRSWNIANNAKYIHDIYQGVLPLETEELSALDRINEYTMTSLRTMWGINLTIVEDKFGSEVKKQLLNNAEEFIYNKQLTQVENQLTLTDTGKLMADHIMSELFIVD
ncbi:Oxygen-independent coproporphyrinogen-III oxidase 1 [compost metagenome]